MSSAPERKLLSGSANFTKLRTVTNASTVVSVMLDVFSCLQEKNMDTYMFERKMDNCKPCGGAIPLCMIDEFSLPEKIVDRKVVGVLLEVKL